MTKPILPDSPFQESKEITENWDLEVKDENLSKSTKHKLLSSQGQEPGLESSISSTTTKPILPDSPIQQSEAITEIFDSSSVSSVLFNTTKPILPDSPTQEPEIITEIWDLEVKDENLTKSTKHKLLCSQGQKSRLETSILASSNMTKVSLPDSSIQESKEIMENRDLEAKNENLSRSTKYELLSSQGQESGLESSILSTATNPTLSESPIQESEVITEILDSTSITSILFNTTKPTLLDSPIHESKNLYLCTVSDSSRTTKLTLPDSAIHESNEVHDTLSNATKLTSLDSERQDSGLKSSSLSSNKNIRNDEKRDQVEDERYQVQTLVLTDDRESEKKKESNLMKTLVLGQKSYYSARKTKRTAKKQVLKKSEQKNQVQTNKINRYLPYKNANTEKFRENIPTLAEKPNLCNIMQTGQQSHLLAVEVTSKDSKSENVDKILPEPNFRGHTRMIEILKRQRMVFEVAELSPNGEKSTSEPKVAQERPGKRKAKTNFEERKKVRLGEDFGKPDPKSADDF